MGPVVLVPSMWLRQGGGDPAGAQSARRRVLRFRPACLRAARRSAARPVRPRRLPPPGWPRRAFRKMLVTWTLAVLGLTYSWAPIWTLVRPAPPPGTVRPVPEVPAAGCGPAGKFADLRQQRPVAVRRGGLQPRRTAARWPPPRIAGLQLRFSLAPPGMRGTAGAAQLLPRLRPPRARRGLGAVSRHILDTRPCPRHVRALSAQDGGA